MIVVSDDGVILTGVFANPSFDMEKGALQLKLSRIRQAHYSPTDLVTVGIDSGFKMIMLSNLQMIDPVTKLLVERDVNTGQYPEGAVGVFDYILSMKLSDLGDPDDGAVDRIGHMIEEILQANGMAQ